MEKNEMLEESQQLPPPNYGPATAPESLYPVNTAQVVTTMVPVINHQPGKPLITSMTQPSSWMPEPIGEGLVLPGLSYFAPLGRLVIFRQVEVVKGKTGLTLS